MDGDNVDELESALQEITAKTESTPETEYLIGLAFFNGIEMERDTDKAVSLIVASACQNLPEAVKSWLRCTGKAMVSQLTMRTQSSGENGWSNFMKRSLMR